MEDNNIQNQLEKLIKDALKDVVDNAGVENVAQLLAGLKMKIHEAEYFSKCKNIKELEDHIIKCTDCLNNMMPIEIFWQMTHHVGDTPCETPMHSKDRFLLN